MLAREEQHTVVVDALKANWRLQQRLEETLKSLEKGINANADEQAKVQTTALRVNRSGWYTGLQVVGFPSVGNVGPKAIGPSRFWVSGGTVPRPNEDTLKLYEAYSYLPHTFASRKWTVEEDGELKKLVLVFVKSTFFEQKMGQLIQEGMPGGEALQDQTEQTDALTMESPGAAEKALAFPPGTWDNIATSHGGTRSGTDCMLRWRNFLRPGLKRLGSGEEASWSKEEDAKLQEVAKRHEHRNWEKVSEDLGASRSALECLARSQYLCKLKGGSKAWSPQEVEVLKESYARHVCRGSFWKAVAAELPGRTPAQVMHFYRNHLDPNIKKGKWAQDEDDLLTAAVGVFGKQWAKVAEAMPTRNAQQVRERWMNMLDPEINHDKKNWTAEEDATLVTAMEECRNEDGSYRWADVATRLPGRTDDQVSNRIASIRTYQLKVEKKKQEPPKRRARKTKGTEEQPDSESKPTKRKKRNPNATKESLESALDAETQPASKPVTRGQKKTAGKAGSGKKEQSKVQIDAADSSILPMEAKEASMPAAETAVESVASEEDPPVTAKRKRGRPPKGPGRGKGRGRGGDAGH